MLATRRTSGSEEADQPRPAPEPAPQNIAPGQTAVPPVRSYAKCVVHRLFRAAERLRRRRIVVYYSWPDFGRKAEAIADLLRRRGLPATVRSGTSLLRRTQFRTSPDLWIGFWNEFPVEYLPANYVFFNGEPLHLPRWRDDRDWFVAMKGALEIWDYNTANEPYVTPLGVPFRYVPFGYTPYYEASFRRHTAGKHLVEDVDVLFVGTLTDRRRAVLDRLRESGVTVHAVTRDNPLHGEPLDRLIARSRISLGIHQFADPDFQGADFARLDHLLSNRRFVVHERLSARAADPVFESHVTTCSYEDIPAICKHFLAHPVERARMAESAYRWFKAERALDAVVPYNELRKQLDRL